MSDSSFRVTLFQVLGEDTSTRASYSHTIAVFACVDHSRVHGAVASNGAVDEMSPPENAIVLSVTADGAIASDAPTQFSAGGPETAMPRHVPAARTDAMSPKMIHRIRRHVDRAVKGNAVIGR